MKYIMSLFWIPSVFMVILIASISLYRSFQKDYLLVNMHTKSLSQADVLGAFYSDVLEKDGRSLIIQNYLSSHHCPLKPYEKYADIFVKVADENRLDFRLLPAIAMQESTCCKNIPEDSFNCWGYGIYGSKITYFNSYDEAISVVGKTLSKKYANKGLNEVDEIMKRYTPGSNGSWAANILQFMYDMK
jgi:hypothetical protein